MPDLTKIPCREICRVFLFISKFYFTNYLPINTTQLLSLITTRHSVCNINFGIFDTNLKRHADEFLCREKKGSNATYRELHAGYDGYLLETD